MEYAVAFAPAVAYANVRLPTGCATKRFRIGCIRAKSNENEDHPLLRAAINRASLRFQETLRPDPLFVDQYAGCLLPSDFTLDEGHLAHNYRLATRFIDDKLLEMMTNRDELKQVVLLTDGMDTRPYRLRWPTSTIMFDVSPEFVSRKAAQKFEDVGAKVRKGCFLRHVPFEAGDIHQTLRSKGFMGDRPSIWALQGLPLETLASFEAVLSSVSSLAMKGCVFLGELPPLWAETEQDKLRMMDRVFTSHGFRVVIISHEEVATNLQRELAPRDYESILFVAEQLRFSDEQMETWRREFQRMEEEGDEDGFEEL